jgi:peptide alpha-N-acetyltransferase
MIIPYSAEHIQDIMALIQQDLSEPYTIYTFRYFLHNWPSHSHVYVEESKIVGVVISRLEPHQGRYKKTSRGYIAMLAVQKEFRSKGIGYQLVKRCLEALKEAKADEVVLEAEVDNISALRLYEGFGFIRDKRYTFSFLP